jgi:hypothetical protein
MYNTKNSACNIKRPQHAQKQSVLLRALKRDSAAGGKTIPYSYNILK